MEDKKEVLEVECNNLNDFKKFRSFLYSKDIKSTFEIIELKSISSLRLIILLTSVGIEAINRIISEYLHKNPDKKIIIGGKEIDSIWISRGGSLASLTTFISAFV